VRALVVLDAAAGKVSILEPTFVEELAGCEIFVPKPCGGLALFPALCFLDHQFFDLKFPHGLLAVLL
jgi:hypothetical protein